MKIFRQPIKEKLNTGSIVVIGNFDGVHKGHQKLIEKARLYAELESAPLILITFYPHTKKFFYGDKSFCELQTLAEKLERLKNLVDAVVVLHFSNKLSQMSAEDFFKSILLEKLNIKNIIVGDRFRFGYKGLGNTELLRDLCRESSRKFCIVKKEIDPELCQPITSSAVRNFLKIGDISSATRCLGSYWSLNGRVKLGERRGRTLGFPTININSRKISALRLGIYSVFVSIENGKLFKGVASFGKNPTFKKNNHIPILEIFLFDFNEKIYEKRVKIFFVSFLRSERYFKKADDLIQQIHKDVASARETLNKQKTGFQKFFTENSLNVER